MAFLLCSANNKLECSICLTSIDNKKTDLNCTHSFHTNCINEWFKTNKSCPLCRKIAKIKEKIVVINIPKQTHRDNKFIWKKIAIGLFFILCIGYLTATVYNLYNMMITSNYINRIIKHLNDTELGDHNHNTYSPWVLVIYDFVYIILFSVANFFLLNKESCKKTCTRCSNGGFCVLLAILYISNFILRYSFVSNLNSYLNDKTINFDQSYNDNMNQSVIIFGIFMGCKIFSGMFALLYII
jgi:hypothetical protein